MHALFSKADQLSREIIGAAIEVHRIMGPGLLESIYENCLLYECELRGIQAATQKDVEIRYKDFLFQEQLRYDLLIESCLLIEVKAVREVLPINKAQLLSYMKLLDIPVGLLLNFHELRLVDGIHRLILTAANR
jgi:GxxExxY protein